MLYYELRLTVCHPKELQDVPGTIVGKFLEGLD
jgi:hypothetical protein